MQFTTGRCFFVFLFVFVLFLFFCFGKISKQRFWQVRVPMVIWFRKNLFTTGTRTFSFHLLHPLFLVLFSPKSVHILGESFFPPLVNAFFVFFGAPGAPTKEQTTFVLCCCCCLFLVAFLFYVWRFKLSFVLWTFPQNNQDNTLFSFEKRSSYRDTFSVDRRKFLSKHFFLLNKGSSYRDTFYALMEWGV